LWKEGESEASIEVRERPRPVLNPAEVTLMALVSRPP